MQREEIKEKHLDPHRNPLKARMSKNLAFIPKLILPLLAIRLLQ